MTLQKMAFLSAASTFVLTMTGPMLVGAASVQFDLENRVLATPLRGLILFLACCAFLASPPARARASMLFLTAWTLFWIFYTLRLLVEHFLVENVSERPFEEYIFYIIGANLVPALATMRWAVQLAESRAALLAVVGLGMLGVISNILLATTGMVRVEEVFAYRLATRTLNPLTLGHAGVAIGLIGFVLYLSTIRLSPAITTISFASVAVGIAAVIASGSRGPFLVFCVCAACALYLSGTFRSLNRITVLGALAIVVVTIFGLAFLESASSYLIGRLEETAHRGDETREQLWADSWRLIVDNPLIGVGLEPPLWTYPHNLIVESFVVGGILTGVPFSLLFCIAIGSVFATRILAAGAVWIPILLMQQFLFGMTSSTLLFTNQLWMLLAMTAVIANSAMQRSRRISGRVATNSGRPLRRV